MLLRPRPKLQMMSPRPRLTLCFKTAGSKREKGSKPGLIKRNTHEEPKCEPSLPPSPPAAPSDDIQGVLLTDGLDPELF